MGILNQMPPEWNSEGQTPPDKEVPDSGIQNNPTDADPGQAGAPPSALLNEGADAPSHNPALDNLQIQTAMQEDPSLFKMVSDKYQDLQKSGAVGQPAPSGTGRGVASSDEEDDNDDSSSSDTTKKDYIKDLLSKIYGNDMSDDALKAAMAKRDQTHQQGLNMMIGSNLAKALSKGSYTPDNAVANKILASSGQPVQDILTRRAAKMQEMEAGLKASDLEDKSAMRDADSPISAAYRNMALQLNPKLADQDDFESMTAEGIKNTLPMVDMSIRMQMLNIQRQQIMMQKQDLDSKKAKSEMAGKIQMVMGRGANSQAAQTILAADKINELFNESPDSSKWNSAQVRLFNTETEKMAKGGIPGEHGVGSLIPPNVLSLMAKGAAFATGQSIPTNQAPMINSLRPYISGVRETSAKFLSDSVYNPIMNGYNKRVTPGDMEDYRNSLPDYLRPNVPSDLQQTNAGKVKVSNGKESYLIDPSDLPHAMKDGFQQVK